MNSQSTSPHIVLRITAIVFSLVAFATAARADIFRWEYINPADPSQGKRQSATLAPHGAGIDAVPGAKLGGRNLTMAYLVNANLTGGDMSQTNLTNAVLTWATLTDAEFNGAEVRGAQFFGTTSQGLTAAQLYSTASYQAHDLTGITLGSDIFGWNFAGQNLSNANISQSNLTGANFIDANLRGAQFRASTLTDANFANADILGANFGRPACTDRCGPRPSESAISLAQLYSTASYQARDLRDIDFSVNYLVGANFAGQNLANASFSGAELMDADFTNAEIRGANLGRTSGRCSPHFCLPSSLIGSGISHAQLYSTASYRAHDLSGVNLYAVWLAGADFAGQNLTNTKFGAYELGGLLAGADLTAADTRGAFFIFGDLADIDLFDVITTNLIRPDGHIGGLDLHGDDLLTLRDYDGRPEYGTAYPPLPIRVDQHFAMDHGGTLRMVFEADAWDSTMSFAPDIPVTLGGTLELTFADDVSLASKVGRTLKIFDWTGVNPTGTFAINSPYQWDTSNLYTTGEVTLTAIPEPATMALAALGLLGLVFHVRRPLPRIHSSSKSNKESHAEAQRRRGVSVGRSYMRPQRLCVSLLSFVLSVVVFASPARADIFQWEYINPADPSQGKRPSATLAPDGAGIDAVPGADLSGRNLTMAYLIDVDLSGADLSPSTSLFTATVLTNADLSQANLTNANFAAATLTEADFTNAMVREANFDRAWGCGLTCSLHGTGISLDQLYSTASYRVRDLRGIGLRNHHLAGANFAGQNLTNADFHYATLTGADFTGAEVRGAHLGRITRAQLYSTASYQAQNLTGIGIGGDLSGGNFAGQNLTNASFGAAKLTNADFTGAEVRGASFYYSGITLAQLYSTASYQTHDSTGITLSGSDLTGGNFAGQNLTNADFHYATLTGADFTGADVRGAYFGNSDGTGITLAQLYSTASYQAHDLSGIELWNINLAGGNFAGQNLTNARFYAATLTGADFTAADARGGYIDFPGSAITTNLIARYGQINGLDVDAGEMLVVRDYDGDPSVNISPIPITIDQHLAMGPGGTLRMVFEADDWDSTISFAPGIPVTLGGTLELAFADDVNLASQLVRTFDLFDWTGVNPTGAFTVSTPYAWDLSHLYTTGEVTLLRVPEPAEFALAAVSAFGLTLYRRWKTS